MRRTRAKTVEDNSSYPEGKSQYSCVTHRQLFCEEILLVEEEDNARSLEARIAANPLEEQHRFAHSNWHKKTKNKKQKKRAHTKRKASTQSIRSKKRIKQSKQRGKKKKIDSKKKISRVTPCLVFNIDALQQYYSAMVDVEVRSGARGGFIDSVTYYQTRALLSSVIRFC